MTSGLPAHVAATAERIISACSPTAVVLFGSYAKGTQTAHSDIDLLVIAHTDEPQGVRLQRLRGMFTRSPVRIDPIFYTPEEIAEELDRKYSFVASVLATGTLIHGSIPGQRENSDERRKDRRGPMADGGLVT
jgi:predicted nucleotidyltransferase